MKKMVRYIDPPAGWKYGFPKILPDDVVDVNKWFVENGYPQAEMDRFGDRFYCGQWFEEVDE